MERSDTTPRAVAYNIQEAARLLGLTVRQIRAYARAGFLDPQHGRERELRLSFQDLVFLRLVKGLSASRIPPQRVHRALKRLKTQLRDDRPLSGVRLSATGRQVVAQEGSRLWNPESGQCLLDLEGTAEGHDVVALSGAEEAPALELVMEAEDWYLLGCELEENEPGRAGEAYGKALELDPGHADAHINLGCFQHAAGKLGDAEAHYRFALRQRPDDDTAAFNLGVVLEDQGRLEEARDAYRATLRANAGCSDAHYNLARVCDQLGDRAAAIRHLKAYRKLVQQR